MLRDVRIRGICFHKTYDIFLSLSSSSAIYISPSLKSAYGQVLQVIRTKMGLRLFIFFRLTSNTTASVTLTKYSYSGGVTCLFSVFNLVIIYHLELKIKRNCHKIRYG